MLVVVKANKLKRKYYFSFVSSLQFRDNYGLAYYFFLIFLLYQKILRCTTNLCVTTILWKEVVKIIWSLIPNHFVYLYLNIYFSYLRFTNEKKSNSWFFYIIQIKHFYHSNLIIHLSNLQLKLQEISYRKIPFELLLGFTHARICLCNFRHKHIHVSAKYCHAVNFELDAQKVDVKCTI